MYAVAVEASPSKLAAELDALEQPERKGEREQLRELVKAAKAIAPTISGREKVLIQLVVHDDPDAEGFNGRLASLSVSRLDPDAEPAPLLAQEGPTDNAAEAAPGEFDELEEPDAGADKAGKGRRAESAPAGSDT